MDPSPADQRRLIDAEIARDKAYAAVHHADVLLTQSRAIETLIKIGPWDHDAIVRAVTSGDLSLLVEEVSPTPEAAEAQLYANRVKVNTDDDPSWRKALSSVKVSPA